MTLTADQSAISSASRPPATFSPLSRQAPQLQCCMNTLTLFFFASGHIPWSKNLNVPIISESVHDATIYLQGCLQTPFISPGGALGNALGGPCAPRHQASQHHALRGAAQPRPGKHGFRNGGGGKDQHVHVDRFWDSSGCGRAHRTADHDDDRKQSRNGRWHPTVHEPRDV